MSATRLTRRPIMVGDILTDEGNVLKVVSGSVSRANTTPFTIGKLPANARITNIDVYGPSASNAGTTATITVGFADGTGNELLNAYDVKTAATGAGQVQPTVVFPTISAKHTVNAVYAETGGASSSGGPWRVTISYVNS